MSDLLPLNASALERAADQSLARLGEIPVPLDFWDPQAAPGAVLPVLAWAQSADVWDPDWTDEDKRILLSRLIDLHQIKGTVAGIKQSVALAGGRVVKITEPPQKLFPAPSMTDAEKRAFYRRYPELRTYHHRDQASARGLIAGKRFAGHVHALPSTAWERYGPRCFLVQDGVETPLRTVVVSPARELTDVIETVEVRRSSSSKKLFPGFFVGSAFSAASTAGERLYRVVQSTTLDVTSFHAAQHTVKPGLSPITAQVELVAQQGPAAGLFPGRAFVGATVYPRRSTAAKRLYQSQRLFDPSIAVQSRGRSRFMGGRLGMAAKTAEIIIDLRRPTHKRRFFVGKFIGNFLTPRETKLYERVMRSLLWSKPASVKTLVSTTTHRPATAGAGHTAGSGLLAGQLVA